MTTTEAEWDETERDWMLALADYEDGLCPSCGRPQEICTASSAEGRVDVPAPTRCHYTTAVAAKRKDYASAPHPEALLFSARPRI